MSVGGYGCSDGNGGYRTDITQTFLDIINTIDSNGDINSWCIYLTEGSPSTSARLIILRSNGSNYDIVGYSAQETIITSGLHTFSLSSPITVQTGDIIAFSLTAHTPYFYFRFTTGGSDTIYQIGQDVITTTAKTDWVTYNTLSGGGNATQLRVHVSSDINNVYIDINRADDTGDGLSWATAKKTMKAGWDILNALGTMHVASGDYSAQTRPTYNKSWKLSPEDPNGLGYKIVKIPPSA
jgi:hypothetical protein